MYTPWCDENGKVIDDGTIQRLSKDKFRITSAEPNLDWIEQRLVCIPCGWWLEKEELI